MNSARRIALEALMDVTDKGAYANLRLKEALHGIENREAAWVSAAVYTTIENLSYIDYIIDRFAKGRMNAKIRGVLRLGICQAAFMDTPHSAACSESVKLAGEIGKGALSGYVNGVMRAVCRSLEADGLPALPNETVKRLSIKYGWPEYMVREYIEDYGEEFTERMLGARLKGMTVRAQYPYTAEELEKELDAKGMPYERGTLIKDAFRLQEGFDVENEPMFADGRITVQSESAMAVSELLLKGLSVNADTRVLDACAAPGGKSAYIASRMQGRGRICAWELHDHRAELMRNTFARLHVENAEISVTDASRKNEEYEESFDAVLVDAPCSGFGVTGKPDIRLARDEGAIEALCELQGRILSACGNYVRHAGVLVYATCTISRRENGAQVRRFLKERADFALEEERQLFPHTDGTEGFYMARMVRS